MLDRLKQSVLHAVQVARLSAKAARISIWGVLLVAVSYADQIMALVDENMPMLASLLPKNIYAFVGTVIVGAKFALQIIKFLNALKAMRATAKGA